MKIALPKEGNLLNQHFGKSKSFAIVEVNANDIVEMREVSTESLQHNHSGLADFLKNQGVELVIAGGIGEGAYNPLVESGFHVIRGASGKIQDVIDEYLKGNLKDKKVLCSHHHSHLHSGDLKRL